MDVNTAGAVPSHTSQSAAAGANGEIPGCFEIRSTSEEDKGHELSTRGCRDFIATTRSRQPETGAWLGRPKRADQRMPATTP